MPISLTVSGHTASGHDYADTLGEQYTYPKRYRKLIVPGETVIFYTGTRSYPGKKSLSYLGIAIVAEIRDAVNSTDGDLQCGFHCYTEFQEPIPFKTAGRYLESKANGNPNHWRQGVRRISMEDLHAILSLERCLRTS